MNIFNWLNKKSWLLLGLCVSLAGVAPAGTMDDTGSGSQGFSGASPGTSGTSTGTSGASPGTSGTSPTTSQGATGGTKGAQGMGKVQPFHAVDKNSDSYVTKSELMDSPSMLKHFDKVDANKDGQLEENEYKNLIMENEQ
ncbi:MAG: hypothetical protein ACR65O_08960 [Methylomicrobium sp.]